MADLGPLISFCNFKIIFIDFIRLTLVNKII